MNKIILAIMLFLAGPAAAGPDGLFLGEARVRENAELDRLRALRRAAMRLSVSRAAKSGEPSGFGLLVIPVDFQDQRLGDGWTADSLSARLFPLEGQSLQNYYHAASGGRARLEITLAPVVHLPGDRLDYSDIGWNGFSRTRALARQSLEAIRDMGLDFAGLDMDGPDGVPGSGDDDGQVDGVLILHAGVGQENDPQEGVIQALQFFLADPVYAGGTAASFYAVASLASGPGIWAHETGHLLGMEDRYDLSLRPEGNSEVVSRGGLGRFSLMASGAWGTGGGWQPALPDAYSLLELGWTETVTAEKGQTLDVLPGSAGGKPVRLWTLGATDPEYFLLEVRDPQAAAPFDAALWANELLVYHIDESLPEGRNGSDYRGERYLRVGLVEADGNRHLQDGLDDGVRSDLFPGSLEIGGLAAQGYPGTAGHLGPTGIVVQDIARSAAGVSLLPVFPPDPALEFNFGVSEQRDRILLEAWPLGRTFTDLRCVLSIDGPSEWGTFVSGLTTVTVSMTLGPDGGYRPVVDPVWEPAGDPPPGASTRFQLVFEEQDWRQDPVLRSWVWEEPDQTLDFGAEWPGSWEISWPEGEGATTWHRWSAEDAPWAAGRPLLACTGAEFSDPSAWPDVQYSNRAGAGLTSGEVDRDALGVRLVHACEFERRDLRSLMDGGLVQWIGPGGEVLPAEPVGGWPAMVSPKSSSLLQGMGVFAGDTLSFREGSLMWQVDVIPIPETGPGPWRLDFRFGANSVYRRRGWFVSEVTALTDVADLVPFQAAWTPTGGPTPDLTWAWPWPTVDEPLWIVQKLEPDGRSWTDLLETGSAPEVEGSPGRFYLPGQMVRSALGTLWGQPNTVRISAFGPSGWVHTRPVSVFQTVAGVDDPDPLLVWPNPAVGAVKFLVDLPAGQGARLKVYDLRGRKLFVADFPGGRQLFDWRGTNQAGAPLSSGVYVVQLEGSRLLSSHKVVLLR